MILAVGDLLLDVLLLPDLRTDGQTAGMLARGGGSAANTAAWVEQLGYPVRFVGCVGDDPIGEMLVKELRDSGVQTWVRRVAGAETGCVAVEISSTGERTMRSSRGANQELAPDDILAASTPDLELIHLTGYALLGRHQLSILQAAGEIARSRGAVFSFDPSAQSLIRHIGAERLLADLEQQGVDVLLPNAGEAECLGGQGLTMDNARYLAERLPLVVVKDGPAGATWSDGVIAEESVTGPLNPVDTTGAGDAFNAGVLVALCRKESPGGAAALGHRIARQVTQHYGGRPEWSRSGESGYRLVCSEVAHIVRAKGRQQERACGDPHHAQETSRNNRHAQAEE